MTKGQKAAFEERPFVALTSNCFKLAKVLLCAILTELKKRVLLDSVCNARGGIFLVLKNVDLALRKCHVSCTNVIFEGFR